MRSCSLLCIIVVIFLGIDQFYSGINYWRLFIGGFFAIAVWTDCGPFFKRYYKRRASAAAKRCHREEHDYQEQSKDSKPEDPCRLPRHLR